MTKEDELMNFLTVKVFGPILDSPKASRELKSGVHLTIGRMRQLDAKGMVQYYWSCLADESAIRFSKEIKHEHFTRFEDVLEEFRDRFNDNWLRQ
jgi:hypothetical protein